MQQNVLNQCDAVVLEKIPVERRIIWIFQVENSILCKTYGRLLMVRLRSEKLTHKNFANDWPEKLLSPYKF